MTLNKLHTRVMDRIPKLDLDAISRKHLRRIRGGAWMDVSGNAAIYYRYLPCLMQEVKPKQVVELGGAMGVSALMMLAGLPDDSKLFSITLAESGQEFVYIKKDYPQLIKVIGDDLDLSNWPKDLNLGKTDILFIDTLHTREQLQKEVDLYFPLLPKGCLVLFDDLNLGDLMKVWVGLDYEKLLTPELHHSGFGLLVI